MIRARYIIDGVRQGPAPCEMLSSLGACGLEPSGEEIVDESLDPAPTSSEAGEAGIGDCLSAVRGFAGALPLPFAAFHAKSRFIAALLGYLRDGASLSPDQLKAGLDISWPSPGKAPVGAMSAFYMAVSALCEYMDALGARLGYWCLSEGEPRIDVSFPGGDCALPSEAVEDPDSWIVYVPFETSDYRLGGSRLQMSAGIGESVAPILSDPDYFSDCYELVREFVQDGVLVAAAVVGEGGLARALDSFCRKSGASVKIADIRRANPRADAVHVLFAEVPGMLIQIKDADFDYIDAEFLLQDVLYYPLGHPGGDGLRIDTSSKSGIESILDSLASGR